MEFKNITASVNQCIKRGVIALSLSVMSVAALAQDQLWKDTQTLLEITDSYKAFEEVNEQFKAQIKQGAQQQKQPKELTQTLLALSDKHLAVENINKTLDAQFKNKLNAKAVADSLAWYRTDLGKNINTAESNAGKDENQQVMMQMAPQLLADEARVKLETRILEILNMSELVVTMQEEITIAFIESMAVARSNGEPVDISPFKQQMAANRGAMKAQVDQYMLIFMLYSHKDFSLEELAKYEAFLSSESGSSFANVSVKVSAQTMSLVMKDMANELKEAIKEQAKAQAVSAS